MSNQKIKLSLATALLVAACTNSQANDLGDITITSATKSEQSIKDVTSNVNVITAEELEEKHLTTVAEALNLVSGVDTISNGGLGQGSYVRINGMHYTTTLVLIDGVRYNDITNGSAFLENILVSDIKQIEIIKGAQSGIWGADASGGVINIITKAPQDGFSGTINAEYGSFATKKYGTSLSYKAQNYYAKLNAQRVTSDGFSAQAPKGVDLDSLEDDSYENTSVSLKAGVSIDDNNKIDLSHTIIDSEVEYDGGDWGDSSLDKANNTQYKSTSKSKFSNVNFNHIDSFNEIDIYASKSSFERKYPKGYTKEYIGDIKEYGLKSNIPYNKKDFVIVGIDRKEFSQEKGYEIEYENNGYFLTNSNTFNDNTIFTQSLRYDTYTSFENKLTGKVGIKHFINDFEISTNYGTGYKAPSLYELSNDGGNDLKPESTQSLDFQVQYNGFSFRAFRNEIDDLLDYVDPDTWEGPLPGVYQNIEGTSVIKGYELAYQKYILEELQVSMNYTRQKAEDKDGKKLGRVADELFKLGLDYYGIKKLHLGINAQYVGDRWDGINNKDTRPNETGRYTIANFITNYQVTEDLKVYAKIDNITDKYYQTVEGYATSPRAYYAGVKYSF